MTQWTINTVIDAVLTPSDRYLINLALKDISPYKTKDFKGSQELRDDDKYIELNNYEGKKQIGGTVILSSDDFPYTIRYTAENWQTYSTFPDEYNTNPTPISIYTGCHLTIEGFVAPYSLLRNLKNKHVSAFIEHPALKDPRLRIEKTYINTRGSEETGCGVYVPQIRLPF